LQGWKEEGRKRAAGVSLVPLGPRTKDDDDDDDDDD
jgi:hypothetical protein